MTTNKKGFTLIEMTVVVAIISVLSAVGVKVSGSKLKNQAIATEAVSLLGVIDRACTMFFVERGYQPEQLEDLSLTGLFQLEDLSGTFFSTEEIQTLIGPENIPLDERGLGSGCGTVNGLTICKLDNGEYSVSGAYVRN
jgi:prepilin-type N-terminal cleavage/methylation domain-containing protein